VAWTVQQIAELVHGELVGNGETTVLHAKTLADAEPGDITFVDGDRNLGGWVSSKAAAGIVPFGFSHLDRAQVRVADPLAAFLKVVLLFRGPREESTGIDPTAHIHASAQIGADARIGPFVVVGEGTRIGANCHLHPGVKIGRYCTLADDVTLFPNVVLYDDCKLGNRVQIHANAVIGADGFGYRLRDGKHIKIPQVGGVEIADDVEIGAVSTIDGGTFGPTRIGLGTKIDNQVMVSHNCQIGAHNILVSQVGIAGSSSTGEYVVMGGQVGVADHIHIGTGALLAAKSGIISDVPAGGKYFGTPAMPGGEFWRCVANWQKMADLRKDVAKIKKRLALEGPA